MFRRQFVLSLALLLARQAQAGQADTLSLRDQLDRPYVSLFDLSGLDYSPHEVKSLRSALEHERNQQLETCRNDEKRLHAQLDSARRSLKQLNPSSSTGSVAVTAARDNLHSQISALEQVRRDKKRECEHIIPASFEIKLAKVQLLEHWPRRRNEAARAMDDGRARERKHGDVEDIGYRKFVDHQEKDVPVGGQALRQMTSSSLMPAEIQDAAVRKYVQDLAGNIARNSDLKVALHVTLVDSAEINAVGLPGGFLFLTSGLLAACETEAELAGVVSQQIAHIAARHATRGSKRSIIAKVFVPATQVATGLFTGGLSNAGAYYGMEYGFQGLGMLVNRALVASDGKALKEADQLGIQYAWKAGFDPKGFVAFLDSVAKDKEYSRTDSFFLTKPPLGERLVDAFTEIQYLPAKEQRTFDSPEFLQAKDRLRRQRS